MVNIDLKDRITIARVALVVALVAAFLPFAEIGSYDIQAVDADGGKIGFVLVALALLMTYVVRSWSLLVEGAAGIAALLLALGYTIHVMTDDHDVPGLAGTDLNLGFGAVIILIALGVWAYFWSVRAMPAMRRVR